MVLKPCNSGIFTIPNGARYVPSTVCGKKTYGTVSKFFATVYWNKMSVVMYTMMPKHFDWAYNIYIYNISSIYHCFLVAFLRTQLRIFNMTQLLVDFHTLNQPAVSFFCCHEARSLEHHEGQHIQLHPSWCPTMDHWRLTCLFNINWGHSKGRSLIGDIEKGLRNMVGIFDSYYFLHANFPKSLPFFGLQHPTACARHHNFSNQILGALSHLRSDLQKKASPNEIDLTSMGK